MLTFLRILAFVGLVGLSAAPLSAHFIFVHVIRGSDPRIEIHFSEGARDFTAGAPMVAYLEQVRAVVPGIDDLEFTSHPWGLRADLPEGRLAIGARLTFGVRSRGEPYLLEYHAKGVGTLKAAAEVVGLGAEITADPVDGGGLQITVLFDGKPAAGAELVVPVANSLATESMVADDRGQVTIRRPSAPLFGIRAMVPEQRSGTYRGKDYPMVKHYTTLTVHQGEFVPSGSDPLAWAVLDDAARCTVMHVPREADLHGKWRATVAGKRSSGDFSRTRGGLRIDSGSDDKPAEVLRAALATAVAVVHPLDPGDSRVVLAPFDEELGVRPIIMQDGRHTVLVIRDRKLSSIRRQISPGVFERVDVVDSSRTHDDRLLPTKLVRSHSAAEGDRLTSVEVISQSFTELDNGVYVPTQIRTLNLVGTEASMQTLRLLGLDEH